MPLTGIATVDAPQPVQAYDKRGCRRTYDPREQHYYQVWRIAGRLRYYVDREEVFEPVNFPVGDGV